jgi:hypothetical protein
MPDIANDFVTGGKPMSREKRRAFLLGVLVGGLLVAVAGGLAWFLTFRVQADELEQAKADAAGLRLERDQLATRLLVLQSAATPLPRWNLGPVDKAWPNNDEMRRDLRNALPGSEKDY